MRQKNIAQSIPTSFKNLAGEMFRTEGKPAKKEVLSAVKSPLRYPGGKSRAVKQILELLPQGLDTLCSPFLGGASIELACFSQLGIKVSGYDAFKPVVNFWQEVIKNPSQLADMVSKYYPLSRPKFYALQKRYAELKDKQSLAAAFFVLNRTSFSGTTLSGGMSPGHPRFTGKTIERLADFQVEGFSVKHADFKSSIPKHNSDFLYLDPPYANGGNLYGIKGDHHTGFDHEGLATILKNRDGWLLSYNDCKMVRDLYHNFKVLTPTWSYGMNTNKKSCEILILSHDYVRTL